MKHAMQRGKTRLAWFLAWLVVAAAQGQDSAPQKYALLVGIDTYLNGGIQGVTPLSFAVKDARALKDMLVKRGWDAVALVEEDATRRRIVRQLHELAITAQPKDKVLIYFAGHGVLDPLGSGNTYWLTHAASLAALAADGIRVSHVLEYVREIPAREKIVLLDHCFSGEIDRNPNTSVIGDGDGPGGGGDGGTGGDEGSRNLGIMATLQPARALYPTDLENIRHQTHDQMVVLGAARGPAFEHTDWGHGMFTKAILDVLADPAADLSAPQDGKISLSEFWSQVKNKMAAMATPLGLTQEALGSDIKLTQLEWALFDATIDAGSEAQELKQVVTNLDMATSGLDHSVKLACFDLLDSWEQREQLELAQDPKHQRVVRELRFIRESGTSTQAEAKKQSLEALVRTLGLVL